MEIWPFCCLKSQMVSVLKTTGGANQTCLCLFAIKYAKYVVVGKSIFFHPVSLWVVISCKLCNKIVYNINIAGVFSLIIIFHTFSGRP